MFSIQYFLKIKIRIPKKYLEIIDVGGLLKDFTGIYEVLKNWLNNVEQSIPLIFFSNYFLFYLKLKKVFFNAQQYKIKIASTVIRISQ